MHVTDVSDQAQVGALMATTADRFGKIDILVSDAAIVPFVPWEELDFTEWRRVMSVNIDGVLVTRRGNDVAAARLIVGSVGSVPFAADTAALAGDPAGFGARAGACAEQAAAGCAPLPDGEASPITCAIWSPSTPARPSLKPSPPPRVARPGPADLAAARNRTIPDVLPGAGEPLRVLFCGINPSLYSAATGWHFARPGNRFWPALHLSGFTPRRLDPAEQDLLAGYGLGITNLVARATAQAAELDAAELRAGGERLAALIADRRPRVLAVAGVTAYRTAFARPRAIIGPQPDLLADARLWVLPNPSGLNAHTSVPLLAQELQKLRETLDDTDLPSSVQVWRRYRDGIWLVFQDEDAEVLRVQADQVFRVIRVDQPPGLVRHTCCCPQWSLRGVNVDAWPIR